MDVETLYFPPAQPISEEIFIMDPLILYPDANWTDDGKITVKSMFSFQNNHYENQEGDIQGKIFVSQVSHVSVDCS